jgi:hypothetical protein
MPVKAAQEQVNLIAALAFKRDESVDFPGRWQRHVDK